MDKLRSRINQNYSKASQFIHRKRFLLRLVTFSTFLLLITFFIADFALAYLFFSSLAADDLGVVSGWTKALVGFEAMLAVAAAVVIKYTFTAMPKLVQSVIIAVLLAWGIIVVSNMGATQIFGLMASSVEKMFSSESEISAQVGDLFGDEVGSQATQEELTPEAKETISISRYIIVFSFYGYAYLMMTFAGVFTWMALGALYDRMQRLNQASKAFMHRYDQLINKEKEFRIAQDTEASLWSLKKLICRNAQDVAIAAYCIGLDYLKKRVGDLKIYGDDGSKTSRYKAFQTFGKRWLVRLNTEVAQEQIKSADASLAGLQLIEFEGHTSNVTDLKIVKEDK